VTDIPEHVMQILVAREEMRREESAEALARLTEREQRLVREAAVMGFVHGRMSGLRSEDPHPKDADVLHNVVLGCVRHSDRYPLIGGQ
jgi:hypothetical protein